MIDVWQKIFISNPINSGVGSYAQVTIESIRNKAILLGYHHSDSHYVVYEDEIDNLIDALTKLKQHF